MVRLTIFNEFHHETQDDWCKAIYPDGMHMVLKEALEKNPQITVRTATQDEPEHGLTDAVLADTDVLIWWGHKSHHKVDDNVVNRVYQRVQRGMGFIPLHSAHCSKPFIKLLGTNAGNLKWRDIGEKEILWVIEPNHPIAKGIDDKVVIPKEEMYGERFDIPKPDETVFISWFEGGEVFRSGCTFTRGYGKIFYFRPGHEAYRTFYMPEIQKIIENAVLWAAPVQYPKPKQGETPKTDY